MTALRLRRKVRRPVLIPILRAVAYLVQLFSASALTRRVRITTDDLVPINDGDFVLA